MSAEPVTAEIPVVVRPRARHRAGEPEQPRAEVLLAYVPPLVRDDVRALIRGTGGQGVLTAVDDGFDWFAVDPSADEPNGG